MVVVRSATVRGASASPRLSGSVVSSGSTRYTTSNDLTPRSRPRFRAGSVGSDLSGGVDSPFRLLWKGSVMTHVCCPSCRLRFSPAAAAYLVSCPECGGYLERSPALSAPSASACLGHGTFPARCPRQSRSRSRFPSRVERDRDRPARLNSRGGARNAARTWRPRRCFALALRASAKPRSRSDTRAAASAARHLSRQRAGDRREWRRETNVRAWRSA